MSESYRTDYQQDHALRYLIRHTSKLNTERFSQMSEGTEWTRLTVLAGGFSNNLNYTK